jgi:iron(III) transport system permease protein
MFKSSQSILQIISTMVLLLVAVPLCYVAINLISSPNKFIEYLVETKTLRLAWNTILLAVTVTVASICISVPLAILTIRSNLPMKRLFRVLLCLPLVFPSYIYGFLFIILFGPKGVLYDILQVIGIDRIPDLYGYWGAFLCLTLLS